MRKYVLVLGLLCALPAPVARAATQPDYLSIASGGYDFDKDQARRKSVDYRLEYQWGVSLLPLLTRSFKSTEPFFQVHPTVGFEGNSKGATFEEAGLNLDIPFLRHGIFTWGESMGAFDAGNDPRPLGSILQFRSQLELGVRLPDNIKVTGYISHISNAHTLSDDPGAEIAGMYVHIPLSGWGRK